MKKVCNILSFLTLFLCFTVFLSWVGLRGIYWYELSQLPIAKLPSHSEVADDLVMIKGINMGGDEALQIQPLFPEQVFYQFIQGKAYLEKNGLIEQAVGLIKNRYPEQEFSDIDDMVLSIWVSQNWNTRDVLVTMLAEGEYGDCCKDIHLASNYYFDKPAYNLDLYESILLVTILNTGNDEPLTNKERIRNQMNNLIEQLKEKDSERFRTLRPVHFAGAS